MVYWTMGKIVRAAGRTLNNRDLVLGQLPDGEQNAKLQAIRQKEKLLRQKAEDDKKKMDIEDEEDFITAIDTALAQDVEKMKALENNRAKAQVQRVLDVKKYAETMENSGLREKTLIDNTNYTDFLHGLTQAINLFAQYTGPQAYEISLFYENTGKQWQSGNWESLRLFHHELTTMISFLKSQDISDLNKTQQEQYELYRTQVLEQISGVIAQLLHIYDLRSTEFTPGSDVISVEDLTNENTLPALLTGTDVPAYNSSSKFKISSVVSKKQKELDRLHTSHMRLCTKFLRELKTQLGVNDRKLPQQYTDLLLLACKTGYTPSGYKFKDDAFFDAWVSAKKSQYFTKPVPKHDDALNLITMKYACYIVANRLLAKGTTTIAQNTTYFINAIQLFTPKMDTSKPVLKKRTPYLSLILDISNDIELKARSLYPFNVDNETAMAAFKQVFIDEQSTTSSVAEPLLQDIMNQILSAFQAEDKNKLVKSATVLLSKLRLRFV